MKAQNQGNLQHEPVLEEEITAKITVKILNNSIEMFNISSVYTWVPKNFNYGDWNEIINFSNNIGIPIVHSGPEVLFKSKDLEAQTERSELTKELADKIRKIIPNDESSINQLDLMAVGSLMERLGIRFSEYESEVKVSELYLNSDEEEKEPFIQPVDKINSSPDKRTSFIRSKNTTSNFVMTQTMYKNITFFRTEQYNLWFLSSDAREKLSPESLERLLSIMEIN